MSLVRSTATIGLYTMISRIFGFIRDMMIASFIGANAMTDAFFVAFKLPNFLRRLFAEGAFNAAFVPLFAGMMAADGREKAMRFASEVASVLLLILLTVTALFMVIMPWFMYVLAPGFSADPAKFDLTVELTRITFPYIIFISLVSLLGGMLNSIDKFAAVAATPVIMNLCFIFAMLAFIPYTETPAHALAIGVILSGAAQLAWLYYFCFKSGLLPKLVRPALTENVKKMLKLIGPAALGAGVAQVNLLVDTIIASLIPTNAVSYLYYADRINELPLAMIGIAVGTALLPMLSRQIREGKLEAANHSQNRAIELALLLSLPAATALFIVGLPIVQVLFERGAFNAEASERTFAAIMAYSIGLPAFILTKVLAPGFYANHDTQTPFKIAGICVLLNFILNLIFMIPLQHVGLALATSIAAWVNSWLMIRALKKQNLFSPDKELRYRLPRIAASCLVMAFVLAMAYSALKPYFTAHEAAQALALSALVACGLVSFGASAVALKAVEMKKLKSYLNRKQAVK